MTSPDSASNSTLTRVGVLSCEGLAKGVDRRQSLAQEYEGIFTTHRDISAWI